MAYFHPDTPRSSCRFRYISSSVLVGITVLACLVIIVFLAKQVLRDLRLLDSATSDNVQWTLSQAEVEFMELSLALNATELRPEAIREEFDIFYSRISTLRNSTLYRDLQGWPDYESALVEVTAFLDGSVVLIDAPDAELLAGVPVLRDRALVLRPRVRALANSGLFYFAELSDRRRTELSVTLLRLALASAVMFGGLALLAFYSSYISRLTRQRGRELADANARMNTILTTSLDGVIVTGTDGRIQDFNTAAERIFQHKFQDVQGKLLGDVIVPEHLRAAHNEGMRRMAESGETRVVGKGRVRLDALRADGTQFPVELALQRANSGEDQIIVGFLRDISRRVQQEKELVEARDRALAGEKAKAEFLAVMSHEIRTPLNGLLGNLSLMEDTRLGKEQQRYIRNMQLSGRLLMKHVDAVLDIARFEAGKTELSDEPVHLSRLLQDVVDGQSGFAEANGNVIEWTWVGPAVDWVSVDPTRLQQIVLNLASNAIKFTRNGRIRIEVEQVGTPSDQNSARSVEFRVIDNGIGISAEDLSKVFEDFHTTDASFGRATGGTGLGLGIARRLVGVFGGEIGAESDPGAGSTFWFRLPLVPAQPPRLKAVPDREEQSAKALDILVVEDNEINQMVVEGMLRKMGHMVTCAGDGRDGVLRATKHLYDVVLMDISMPVMDGLEATKTIRAGAQPYCDTPIVAVSANVLSADKDRFVEAGMNGFLGKPLIRDELAAVVQQLANTGGEKDEAMTAGYIDVETLNEMRTELGEDVYGMLRDRFITEGQDLMVWLSLSPEDLEEVAKRCHKTAGSAAAFGAEHLRDTLVSIESAAKAGDAARVGDLVRNADGIWSEVKKLVA